MRYKAWIKDYGRYLLWFAALLPLAFLRDFTPSNELRYMSIADEALREGHWFAFYHQGEPYADKPPLYLWIVMLGRWLFGDGCMGFVSLFSILPALGIVAVMDCWVRTADGLSDGLSGGLDARRRAAGQWMLLTTAFFAGSMVVLRMDMLMSLFIVLALRVFYRMYAGGEKPGDRWLFPLLVFMALFTKGPYGVMIPVAGAMVFLIIRRRWPLFGRCFGWRFWLVLVGLSGIWWGLVYAEGGYDYLHNLLFNQTVNRAVDSFSHKRGFFYYFWSFGHAAAPWSPLYIAVLLTGLVAGLRRWNGRKRADAALSDTAPAGGADDLSAFFITVFLTSLIMLSCVSAKLEVYLLPVYPFVVYYVLLRMPLWENRGWARVLVSVPLAVLTAALSAVWLLPRWMPDTAALLRGFPIYIAAVVLTAGGLWGWRLLWGRRDMAATVRLTGLSLFVAIFFGAFQLPKLNPYMGYGALARAGQALAAEQQAADTDVVYGAYRVRRAVGMAAYVKRPVREMADWDEVERQMQAGRPLLMFISGKALAETSVAAAVAGRPVREAGPYQAVWFEAARPEAAETPATLTSGEAEETPTTLEAATGTEAGLLPEEERNKGGRPS